MLGKTMDSYISLLWYICDIFSYWITPNLLAYTPTLLRNGEASRQQVSSIRVTGRPQSTIALNTRASTSFGIAPKFRKAEQDK